MKVVLAYSGGLDTSVILHWIKEQYQAEVYTYTANVGQDQQEVAGAEAAAFKTGAADAIVEDLRDEFVTECIFPALAANAVYENYYLMGTSLARPVTARGLVRAAEKVGADAIAHGATGKGNDQVRFELAAYALNPDIQVIAPWREWSFKGRSDLLAYAKQVGLDLPATSKPSYSMDANLMHISYEGGVLEDPWASAPDDMFKMTCSPEQAPDQAQDVTIGFEQGIPVSIDGQRLGPVELVTLLNEIGGSHGIGRIDIVENRYLGMKSRGVYETPGVTLLQHALRAVESITLDKEVYHLRDELSQKFATMVYNGFWFSPERQALSSLVKNIQQPVTGEARLKLYKGQVSISGRRAEQHSIYDPETASFEAEDVYQQSDATGFIKLAAMRLRHQSERIKAAS